MGSGEKGRWKRRGKAARNVWPAIRGTRCMYTPERAGAMLRASRRRLRTAFKVGHCQRRQNRASHCAIRSRSFWNREQTIGCVVVVGVVYCPEERVYVAPSVPCLLVVSARVLGRISINNSPSESNSRIGDSFFSPRNTVRKYSELSWRCCCLFVVVAGPPDLAGRIGRAAHGGSDC